MGSKNSEYCGNTHPGTDRHGRQEDYTDNRQASAPARGTAAAVNSRPTRRSGTRIIMIIICAVVVVFCLGGISAMSGLTFMPRWLPWTVAVAVALGTGMWGKHLWRWIANCRRQWVNYLLHTVMTSLLICFGMYLGNQLGASDCGNTVEAEVLNVYRETRYHSKRVSRNRYVRSDPYYVYFARLKFENGLERDVPVSNGRYRRLRPGTTVDVEVHRGGLGYDVIKPDKIKEHPHRQD